MVNELSKDLRNTQPAVRDILRAMAVKISTGYGYWAPAMVFMKANDISEPDVQAIIMSCEIERVSTFLGVERFTITGTDTDDRSFRILLCTDDERSRFEIIRIEPTLGDHNHENLPGLRGT